MHPIRAFPYVLRGWDTGNGPAHLDMTVKGRRVRNIPTNVRNFFNGGTEYNGNSIFIFEITDLCIRIGVTYSIRWHPTSRGDGTDRRVAPMVDGAYSLSQYDIIQVIDQIKPQLIISIHYFGPTQLEKFFAAHE